MYRFAKESETEMYILLMMVVMMVMVIMMMVAVVVVVMVMPLLMVMLPLMVVTIMVTMRTMGIMMRIRLMMMMRFKRYLERSPSPYDANPFNLPSPLSSRAGLASHCRACSTLPSTVGAGLRIPLRSVEEMALAVWPCSSRSLP